MSAEAMCVGKTGYLAWAHARRVLLRAKFADRRGRGVMRIYRCRFCGFWHLGHSR